MLVSSEMESETEERHAAELELIAAMYPEEYEGVDDTTCKVQITDAVVLVVDLPMTYPTETKPTLTLEFTPEVANKARNHWRQELERIHNELTIGSECLDEVINALKDVSATASSDINNDTSNDLLNTELEPKKQSNPEDQRKLVLIWSHHILATSKRKFLHDQGKALHLRGIIKPGHPGIMVIEGAIEDVDTFIEEVKALRWQALAVRDELVYPVGEEGSRLTLVEGKGHVISEVGSLSDITAALRGSEGMEEWLLKGLGVRR